jgi:peptidyl-prolyl cis-trans isomerase C
MSNGVRIIALIVGLALMAGAVFLYLNPQEPRQAQPPVDPNDTVLASVNGEAIRNSEMERIIAQLPENARALPRETLRPLLLDQMINQKLVLQAATAQKVKETPEYAQRLAAATERAIQETYFEKIVKAQVTDEAVKKRYDEFVAANPPDMEVRARHILVPSEAEAKKVIDRLKKGEAFEALATELTQDPTGKTNGGDLGYFSRGMMVEPFANAAFAMQPGQTSPEPVQTQFGWHVIKVEDRRPGAPPPLEQLQPQLQNQLTQEIIQAHLAELKTKATIENTLAPVESANPPASPAAPNAAPAAPATP